MSPQDGVHSVSPNRTSITIALSPLKKQLFRSGTMDAVMENLRLSSLTQRDGPLFNIIVFVGLISSISLLARLVSFALPFVKPSGLRRYLHTTAGRPAWALVTGATDGIGKQIARELAGHGFNVVLHGRNPAKLSGCRGELARDFPGREFRALVADASAVPCAGCQAGPAGPATRSHDGVGGDAGAAPVDFDAIAASLADLNLTVLVNNVGGNPYPPVYQYLQDNAASKLTANNHLNALFPLILQSKLIPSLLRNSPSLIMNIGSMSDVGIPMLSAVSIPSHYQIWSLSAFSRLWRCLACEVYQKCASPRGFLPPHGTLKDTKPVRKKGGMLTRHYSIVRPRPA